MTLKTKIIKYAKEIGIDIIGFTDAEGLTETQRFLTKRYNNAIITPFTTKDISLRCNPKLTLSEAKSIIVIGISYNNQHSGMVEKNKDPLIGRLSRSAQGIDYHLVLNQKMDSLVRYIQSEVCQNFKYQIMVDTGPLVEREIARKAGIGFYGYNCCIINQSYGSWIFLGEILTDLELESDLPCGTSCAGCNLCLENCPTGALQSPYELIPDRCLSYITQKGGFIPEKYRRNIGNRLFGCDNCQDFCPHNNDITVQKENVFQVNDNTEMNLVAVLKMTDIQFKEWFGNSAAGWRKKSILQRNAAVGLGNTHDRAIVPDLAGMLNDNSTIVRGHVAWALGEIGGSEALAALSERLKIETDRQVRNEISNALNAVGK